MAQQGNTTPVRKKVIVIGHCDQCPYLVRYSDTQDGVEVFRCGLTGNEVLDPWGDIPEFCTLQEAPDGL